MKPCYLKKRDLTWMAANALEECQQDDLRRHLQSCPGCREYWESLTKLTKQLVPTEVPPLEPTPSFHRAVVRKIAATTRRPAGLDWVESIPRCWSDYPVAMVALVVLFVFAGWLGRQHFPQGGQQLPSHHEIVHSPPETGISPSSLGFYRRVATHSLDGLDQLLMKEESWGTASSHETFTVSSLNRMSLEN